MNLSCILTRISVALKTVIQHFCHLCEWKSSRNAYSQRTRYDAHDCAQSEWLVFQNDAVQTDLYGPILILPYKSSR